MKHTLDNDSRSYSTFKNRTAEFKRVRNIKEDKPDRTKYATTDLQCCTLYGSE